MPGALQNPLVVSSQETVKVRSVVQLTKESTQRIESVRIGADGVCTPLYTRTALLIPHVTSSHASSRFAQVVTGFAPVGRGRGQSTLVVTAAVSVRSNLD